MKKITGKFFVARAFALTAAVAASAPMVAQDDFDGVSASIGVSKIVKIAESFSLPVFARATLNPSSEGVFFAVGLGL